jgi:acyl-coenzyme A thioesterase PaaI-like protein
MKFGTEDGVTIARFTPGCLFQGYAGIVHGGILATVMDEAMAQHLLAQDYRILTVSMEVRFRAPADPEEELEVRAWETSRRGRLFHCESRITTAGGVVVADSKGVYLGPPAD